MNLKIEAEREENGRWIAAFLALPGCLACGQTQADALARAKVRAWRIMADRREQGGPVG
jgi:predicted RNase H-like HicB family nuclease